MKTSSDIEAWASAYIEFQSADHAEPDSSRLWWAVSDFMQMYAGGGVDPEDGWRAILEILVRNPPDKVIAVLAAGPLEDLLAEHGEQFIERVETESRRNAAFRNLLSGVWKNGSTDTVWARVQKAQGTIW